MSNPFSPLCPVTDVVRDPNLIAATLRRHLVRGSQITGVKTLSAGHSNETYLLEGLDLILRLPPAGIPLLADALDVVKQFEVFAVLRGRSTDVPIPTLFHLERDESVLGAPFFLMERVEGLAWDDWRVPEWVASAKAQVRRRVFFDSVKALCALHQQAPLDTLGAVRTNSMELDVWRNASACAELSTLNEAIDLLNQSTPEDAAPAPCHGDAKLTNMLWRGDGTLAAWLDWELAFNGDPRWDLAYFLGCLGNAERAGKPGYEQAGFWQHGEVVEAWQHGTGRTSERLRWFEAAYKAKVGAILALGYWKSVNGISRDPRLATWKRPAQAFADVALHLARIGADSNG
jgi:aminoglycoside phosphotransferase (APT) family kinase protein